MTRPRLARRKASAKARSGPAVQVSPVTRESWGDLERLFEARGGPHYCWCMPYRLRSSERPSGAERRACLRKLVDEAIPVGVVAYAGDEPVGWCSIAPRETYVRLERSHVMPRKTPLAAPTWTVLCFFIARPHRKHGVARALLEGAVAYARAEGAEVVEGYPFDTAGVTATHHGHSSLFRAAGFRQDPGDRRWSLRLGHD